MRNILSYSDFLNPVEIEELVYTNEINEGFRSWLNKRAKGKVEAELIEEIELSKTIMAGIKQGLESLNDNFSEIKNKLESDKDDSNVGEKKKVLDTITKLVEDSKKATWDISDLIDEGEVDYSGFTANVGIASATYFGILLFPFHSAIIIHKGYNYFFTLIKNTIRKALVMLQLNFDQFENLIITKSFQSMGYISQMDSTEKISDFYNDVYHELFGKGGTMKNKRGATEMQKQMQAAREKVRLEMEKNKKLQQSENAYNCLDQYNNTYTKSLETLRQYSQEDVQKQLEAIKSSMNKLAAGDVDLVAFGELIIASAEEHAYKVSSSIYNRFAKLTEVFSLPNQQKMIDLIQQATKEEQDRANKEAKKKAEEESIKNSEEKAKEIEDSGKKIFTETSGVSATLGDFDDENKKYKSPNGKEWTYEKFEELKDDDKDSFSAWLLAHQEVLDSCDDTLKIALPSGRPGTGGFFEYVDSLVDDIDGALISNKRKSKTLKESYIRNFDEYMIEEGMKKETKQKLDNIIDDENTKSFADLLNAVLGKSNKKRITTKSYNKLKNLQARLGERKTNNNDNKHQLIKGWYKELGDFIEYIESVLAEAESQTQEGGRKSKRKTSDGSPIEPKKDFITDEEKVSVEIDREVIDIIKYYIDLNRCADNIRDIKELYADDMNTVSKTALKIIGDKLLKDNKFIKMADIIVDKIIESYNGGKPEPVEISVSTYAKLKDGITKLKDIRNNDYNIYYLGENTEKAGK